MAKVPDSKVSESWTARVPNDLADLARQKAISIGMTRQDGVANTTAILHAALKQWLDLTNDTSNSVNHAVSTDTTNSLHKLETQVAELTNALSNTVKHSDIEILRDEILSNSQSDRTITKDDLTEISDRLNKLGTLPTWLDFETLKNEVAAISDRLTKLETLINSQVSSELVQGAVTENLLINGLENHLSIPDAIATETKQDIHLYPIGAKLSILELSNHLGFHHRNYSTQAKAKGLTTEQYVNHLASAKGEQWKELIEGTTKYFVRG